VTGAAVPASRLRPREPPPASSSRCSSASSSRAWCLMVFPLFDDAFIIFRYAKNLVAGHGFVYNPGERVLGTTAPLWGMVSAIYRRAAP
jgi:hypothetical protein